MGVLRVSKKDASYISGIYIGKGVKNIEKGPKKRGRAGDLTTL